MVLQDTSPPSSQSAGLLNKVAIPCPSNSSLNLLACRAVSSMTLNSVTEAAIGEMLPQDNEHLGPPEAARGKEGSSPGRLQGTWPCWHLDFSPLASRAVREYIPVAESHQVCGSLLQQAWETNTQPPRHRSTAKIKSWRWKMEAEKSPQDTSHSLQHKAMLAEFEARGSVSGTRATINLNPAQVLTGLTSRAIISKHYRWNMDPYTRVQSLRVYNTQHSKIIRHAQTLTHHVQTAKSQK